MSQAPTILDLLSQPASIHALHRTTDELAQVISAPYADQLQCRRGCNACCVDDLTVWEVEAAVIREHYPALLLRGTPGPEGACAFLGTAGECRIYAHRPYVCRTQGLPLRWIDEDESGELAELRDICELNASIDLLALDDGLLWTIGYAEEGLARLEEARGEPTRVALRGLFGG